MGELKVISAYREINNMEYYVVESKIIQKSNKMNASVIIKKVVLNLKIMQKYTYIKTIFPKI